MEGWRIGWFIERYKWKMGENGKTSFGENYGVKTVRGCVEEEFGSGIVGRRVFGWFSAMNERWNGVF